MSVFELPTEVWKDIAFNWITFPEVIRFDAAISLESNTLTAMHAEHEYSIPDEQNLLPQHLHKLSAWIHSRKVFIRSIMIDDIQQFESALWGSFLQAVGDRIHNLTICGRNTCSYLFKCAAVYCTNLSGLCLQYCAPGASNMRRLLKSNAQTLRSLKLSAVRKCAGALATAPVFPHLDIVELYGSEDDNAFDVEAALLLSKCPNLTALHLGGDLEDHSLAHIIAANCTMLQRLELAQLFNADAEYILIIAIACKNITYLSVEESMEISADEMCQLLQYLPKLHTLAYWDWDDEMLEAVATIGTPVLRNMHFTNSKISMTGFRIFTQANPHLTGLSLYEIYADEDLVVDECHVLQHCAELLYLQVELGSIELSAVLESLALYCPKLQILDLGYCEQYCAEQLKAQIVTVLEKCPQLRKLMLPTDRLIVDLPIPHSNAGLIVACEDTIYPEWIPFVRHN